MTEFLSMLVVYKCYQCDRVVSTSFTDGEHIYQDDNRYTYGRRLRIMALCPNCGLTNTIKIATS